MPQMWNLWHGCRKISPGCLHCYVYRQDSLHGKDSRIVAKTAAFGLPVRRKRDGSYKVPPGETLYVCLTSDFFIEEADEWRAEAWRMIRERDDLRFFIITKRIDRFRVSLPDDWGGGYENVTVGCTVENQEMADRRLPVFRKMPVRHKAVVCAPLIGRIDLTRHLDPSFEEVSAGGESGPDARICRYEWVLDLHRQCRERNIPFLFHQTGARLEKEGRIYRIPRSRQHEQARKAGIDFPEKYFHK